jgi:LemA protein
VARLLAVAEAYSELKASTAYLELQQRISALEDQIAHRREYYNDAVNLNNVRMEQFPNMFLTGIAGLVRRELFAATEQERHEVDVGALLAH